MNHEEAILLTGYVHQLCPAQEIGDGTGLAWHDVLSDLPYDVCRIAVAEVKKTCRFIDPVDIRAMVTKMLRLCRGAAERRFDAEDDTPPPDVEEHLAWLRNRQRAIKAFAYQAITSREYDPHMLAIEDGNAA